MATLEFQLYAQLILASAILAGTSAQAQTPLTNTGVEPNASGEATLADVAVTGFWVQGYDTYAYGIYSGHLTLSAKDLTPGATYRVGPTQVTRSRKGQWVPSYLLVTASENGALELSTPVTFVGGLWQWVPITPYDGYWEFVEYFGYDLSVDRQVRKSYAPVLAGRLY